MKTQIFKIVLLAALLPLYSSLDAHSVKYDAETVAAITSEVNNAGLNEELEIEEWMVNDTIWKIKEAATQNNEEVPSKNDLKIEKWMTDDTLWKMETANTGNI